MKITCISDLHGFYPKLSGGDLLIIAGDLTARDSKSCWDKFFNWLDEQNYAKKIYIGGNHDNFLTICCNSRDCFDIVYGPECEKQEYLCDSGTEFEGLKIWGTPWTATFEGMNPHCKAFTCDTEEELAEKWALIPNDIDILITHSPPYGILDRTCSGKYVGSKSLQMELFTRLNPKLFICGHIHEAYGIEPKGGFIENAINASHVNERYEAINKSIDIIL